MKNTDIELYNYNLPKNLIAQTPIKTRDHSRLLVLDKNNGKLYDRHFNDILDFLTTKDVLVLNNTKVIPARIIGIKEETNAKIEVLLLRDLGNDTWECLVKPQKRVSLGTKINFNNILLGEVIEKREMGITLIKFSYEGMFLEILNKVGVMPLPPYIHKNLSDQSRYQTVYAKVTGSAAAPTAGLHFTKELLESIKKKGVEILYVTLNVGLGTFKPVEENNITKHVMHSETYEIDEYTAFRLNEIKKEGKRIVCVGTTVVRTLEANYKKYNCFKSTNESTNIFIYPGYKFNVVDGLITNFHLPKSSLVMLVSALASRNKIMKAYEHAIKNEYRFFSFGDAMFISKHITLNNEFKDILYSYKEKPPYYQGSYFKVFKGSNDILVSAPHAGRHIRNKKNKIREYGTSKIATLLNHYKDVHIIYTNTDYNEDANYNENTEYKTYLLKYIKENNIKHFIDIHGMENTNAHTIEIGSDNFNNVSEKEVKLIIKCFNKNRIKNIKVDEKYKSNKRTLSKAVNEKLNIVAIQFEINKRYRRLSNKPRSFYKIICSFIDIIGELKGGLK